MYLVRRRVGALTVAAFALGAALVAATGTTPATAASADPPLLVTTTSLSAVETGQPLAIQLDASGGTTPYQWVPDALPAGVTITSGGLIGGAPTSTGTQAVAVSVVDADNQRVNATLQLQVGPGPAITTSALPDGQVGQGYSIQLSEANGVGPFTWSVHKGGLPGGLVLSSSGLLSGRPGTPGTSTIDLQVTDSLGSSAEAVLGVDVLPPPLAPEGYVTADAAGRTVSAGLVAPSSPGRVPGKTVALAVEPSGAGYWTVSSAGNVHAFGQAHFFGSVARRDLEGSIVGIAAPIGGTGYWVVSSTGHVYGFGAERSLGSPRLLRGKVVGIAATPAGRGYWTVTSTGQVDAFGAARPLGSVPSRALRGRIVAIAAATTVPGYWLVSSTGRVYGFGGARPLHASASALTGTIVGIAAAPQDAGAGYWLLTSSGAVFAFGGAREVATSPPQPLTGPAVPVPPVGIAGAR